MEAEDSGEISRFYQMTCCLDGGWAASDYSVRPGGIFSGSTQRVACLSGGVQLSNWLHVGSALPRGSGWHFTEKLICCSCDIGVIRTDGKPFLDS